jgi:CheY-like chemotaxis protein
MTRSREEPQKVNRLRAILADDEDELRCSITTLLRSEGFDARCARDGREALDLIEVLGDSRCVLILDLMMPIMSGYELLDMLQKRRQRGIFAVIVCSASMDPRSVPSGVQVLSKVFDADALVLLVEHAREAQAAGLLSAVRWRSTRKESSACEGCSTPRHAK